MELKVKISNANTWKSLQRVLATAASDGTHVLLGQEHHLLADKIPDASQWALARGWFSLWLPAQPTAEGSSAGVAVFARTAFGLVPLEPERGGMAVHPHRVLGAVLQLPSGEELDIFSVYLHTATGISGDNIPLLADLGGRLRSSPRAWLAGGDWNISPETLLDSSFVDRCHGSIFATQAGQNTCTQGSGSRIDFFVLHEPLGHAVQSLAIDRIADTSPHRPVDMVFVAAMKDVSYPVYRVPPFLPKELPVGPRPAPPDWGRSRMYSGCVLTHVAERNPAAAHGAFFQAYRALANTAEKEIADAAGVTLPRYGLRGAVPAVIFRPALEAPTDKKRVKYLRSRAAEVRAGWRWVTMIATQLRDAMSVSAKNDFVDLRLPPVLAEIADGEPRGIDQSEQLGRSVSRLQAYAPLIRSRLDARDFGVLALQADALEEDLVDWRHRLAEAENSSQRGLSRLAALAGFRLQ